MKKGLLPNWGTAILGFILLVMGIYIGVAGFANPIALWIGVIIAIIGLVMIFIAAVLS